MRILIITKNYPPNIDGVGDYSYHLKKALEGKLGVEKVFVATSFQKEISEKQNFFYFHKWDIKEFKALNQYIKKYHVKTILFQYVPYSFNKWGVPLLMPFKLKCIKVKKIITFHEIAIGYESINLKSWLIATLQRLTAWMLAFSADAVITSTGLYFKMLKPFNKNTFRVGIGPNFLLKQKVSVETAGADLKVTSFANRITPSVLAAIKILISKGIKIQLIALGNILNDRRCLIEHEVKELEIEEAVYITGVLSEEKLLQILIGSDFYLQIEHIDKKNNGGISLKSGALAVAMSCGLPIITTNGKMTDMEILRDKHEVFYTLGTPVEIAASIQQLIEDPLLLKALRKNSYKYFHQNLRWKVICRQYFTILESLQPAFSL